MKTPSKTGKKKRKSIAVGQEMSIRSKENGLVEGTEVVKDNAIMQIKTSNKEIAKHSNDEIVVSNEISLAEDAELLDELASKSKTSAKKIKRKSALLKISDTEK